MHVLIATTGSRGDVEPAIALGLELRRRGHSVTALLPGTAVSRAERFGLAVTAFTDPVEDAWLSDRRLSWRERIRLISRDRTRILRQFDELVRVSDRADLLVCSMTFAPAALGVREKTGLPVCLYSLTPPFVRSRVAELPWLEARGLEGWAAHASYRLFEQALWIPMRGAINRWRRARLGLTGLGWNGLFDGLYESRTPWLLAVSPVLFPPAEDWPDHVAVTGFWTLDDAAVYHPPRRVTAFLERGEAPVCVTFGSANFSDPARATESIRRALGSLGLRGILIGGSAGLHASGGGADFLTVGDVPYGWIFPRSRVVVHHAGAGAVAYALRAGIPSVVVPSRLDQRAFARRLHQRELLSEATRATSLDPDHLERAILAAHRDELTRARTRTYAARIASERGCERAADRIEALAHAEPAGTERSETR